MMVRVKIPQGVLTAPQLYALAEVAERYSTGRGHITTRQNVQFHFVRLAETDEALRAARRRPGSPRARRAATRSATSPPARYAGAVRAGAVRRHALRGSRHPPPACAGRSLSSLPRKFKIAFGGCCGTDCVGASFNDVGLLARVRDGKPGFRVTLGGGLSTLRRARHPRPRVRSRRRGDRDLPRRWCASSTAPATGSSRHKARLKFVIDKLGPEEFLRQYFAEREQVAPTASRWLPRRRRASRAFRGTGRPRRAWRSSLEPM